MENKAKHRKMAKRVLGYIKAFPEKHNQNSWVSSPASVRATKSVCNTTLCAAGTAVFLHDGVQSIINSLDLNSGFKLPERARELLGLTPNEADALFYSNNKSARRLLKAIAKGNQKKFDRIAYYPYN